LNVNEGISEEGGAHPNFLGNQSPALFEDIVPLILRIIKDTRYSKRGQTKKEKRLDGRPYQSI
jgi:hypothetical protein